MTDQTRYGFSAFDSNVPENSNDVDGDPPPYEAATAENQTDEDPQPPRTAKYKQLVQSYRQIDGPEDFRHFLTNSINYLLDNALFNSLLSAALFAPLFVGYFTVQQKFFHGIDGGSGEFCPVDERLPTWGLIGGIGAIVIGVLVVFLKKLVQWHKGQLNQSSIPRSPYDKPETSPFSLLLLLCLLAALPWLIAGAIFVYGAAWPNTDSGESFDEETKRYAPNYCERTFYYASFVVVTAGLICCGCALFGVCCCAACAPFFKDHNAQRRRRDYDYDMQRRS